MSGIYWMHPTTKVVDFSTKVVGRKVRILITIEVSDSYELGCILTELLEERSKGDSEKLLAAKKRSRGETA